MAEQNTQPEETIEDGEHMSDDAHDGGHIASDTTDVLGLSLPFPIYTTIFVILAVLTIVEVVVGTGGTGTVAAIVLAALATGKAYLVVSYYMHLRTDNRLFTYTLMIPLVVGILGILWLLLVAPEIGSAE